MVGAAILLCLTTGATLAWAATKIPSHVVVLERCGGALIVISLLLLGGSLPFLHYRPAAARRAGSRPRQHRQQGRLRRAGEGLQESEQIGLLAFGQPERNDRR